MPLRHLELVQFRNLERQSLEFPAAGVVLLGANAQGKSNLLEAIYYLETFRSFRGARDAHLVQFDEDLFRVAAEIRIDAGEGVTSVSAAYRHSDRTKRVSLDGEPAPKMSLALGRLGAVVFSPADVDVVSGPPEGRRRFLDLVLSLNAPGYLGALQSYRKALSQRNAALRTGAGSSAVAAWNPTLARTGAQVVAAREAWVRDWSPRFGHYYAAVAGGSDASLEYRATVKLDVDTGSTEFSATDAEARFLATLEENSAWEERARTTVVGPHRDELKIRLGQGEGDIDVRGFGSGGQRRTAALALRLVEAAQVRQARGQAPTVLMDDVFAELDEERSRRVIDLVKGEDWGQIVLTAPKESDVRFGRAGLERWIIEQGRIST